MDVFTKLFGEFLVFVYHCFDRIVIHGYLTALSRPELVVHFFRDVVGVAEVSKEVLSQRTNDYQRWVEAYARNHSIPIEWAEKGVRKEDHVLPWLHRMARRNAYGVYFIFKSMEQGPTYRISLPKYPSKDPHYRILARQRSRFTHYYFYVRDEALGPMVLRVASFFPFQTAYYLNGHSFIEQELKREGIGFRKHDNAFLAVDDVAALQAAADRLSPEIIRRGLDYWTLILGPKFSKKERATLNLSRLRTAPTVIGRARRWRSGKSTWARSSRCRAHRLRSLREGLWPQPAALRPAQAQRAWPDRARWLTLRLPPQSKRNPAGAAFSLLPQAPVWTARQ